jgi:hypothetical protein
MLYKNNKAYADNVNKAECHFYQCMRPNGQRLNERKGKSLRLAKLYSASGTLGRCKAEAMKKRAGRVFGCSSHMEMAIGSGGCYYILAVAKIDRAPLANASVPFFATKKVRNYADLIEQTNAKDGLIFGTLTIKNPPIVELKDYLKILSKAFARMFKEKSLK